MTLEEFKRLAETWGGDMARWPEASRAAAEALAQTADARQILEDARQLDRLIDAAAPEISEDRVSRAIGAVTIRLAAPERPRFALLPLTRWLVPATSFACAAAVGASFAFIQPLNIGRPQSDGAILTLLLDSALLEHDWVVR